PVVHPRPLQAFFIQPEAQGLDQVEPRPGSHACPSYISCIGRYLRLMQHDIQHLFPPAHLCSHSSCHSFHISSIPGRSRNLASSPFRMILSLSLLSLPMTQASTCCRASLSAASSPSGAARRKHPAD